MPKPHAQTACHPLAPAAALRIIDPEVNPMKKLLVLSFLSSGLAVLAAAGHATVQTPPTKATVPAPRAAAPSAPSAAANPLQKKLEEALGRMDKGDDAGAIQILEPLRKDPNVTPPVLSLLGGLYLKKNRPKEAMEILKPLADAPDADPAVLFNSGRAALALNQNDQGIEYLHRSVELVPGSPAARTLGLLLARQGQPGPAFQVLLPWVQATPDDTEARLAAALLAINLQLLPEAEGLLKGMPVTNPRVRMLAGDLALRQGKPKAAITTLRPLLDSPPPGFDTQGGMQLDLRRLLAEAYLRTGQAAESIKLLTGREKDPSTALLLAEAQRQNGNLQAGLATLSPWAGKILKAGTPRDPDLVVDMALAYGRMLAAAGRQAEAEKSLAVATHLAPENPEAWQAYGQTLFALGRKDDSTKALARFRDLSAAQAKAKAAAASKPAGENSDPVVALIQKGQIDKALAAAREEIRTNPKDLRPRALEVRILLLQQHPEEAYKSAQKMVDLAPANPDAIYARGVCQLALKKNKEAEVDLRQALKIQPQHVAAMNDLAVLLMLQGQRAEAKTLLERVLKARPGDQMAAENLKKLKAEGKAGG
jgi:tetratricopeptide (TPR) repeat protein